MSNSPVIANPRFAEGAPHLLAAEKTLSFAVETAERETHSWVEQQLSRFDALLRANFNLALNEFLDVVLYEIAKTVKAIQGVVYLSNDNNELEAYSGYACSPSMLKARKFKIGEGLVGQSARSGESFAFDNLNSGFDISTGLTKIAARSIIVIPLISNTQTMGVIELCFIENYRKSDITLLQRLSINVASSIQSIANRFQIQRILEDTQQKNNELISKEEELRQNLEELEATQDQMRTFQQEVQRQKSEQEKFVALVEHSMNHILIADSQTLKITYANELAQSFFDLGDWDGTFFENSCQALLKNKTHENLGEFFQQIVSEGITWQGELELNIDSADFRIVFQAVVFELKHSETNLSLGLAILLQDITEQKQEEENYAALRSELEAYKAKVTELERKIAQSWT